MKLKISTSSSDKKSDKDDNNDDNNIKDNDSIKDNNTIINNKCVANDKITVKALNLLPQLPTSFSYKSNFVSYVNKCIRCERILRILLWDCLKLHTLPNLSQIVKQSSDLLVDIFENLTSIKDLLKFKITVEDKESVLYTLPNSTKKFIITDFDIVNGDKQAFETLRSQIGIELFSRATKLCDNNNYQLEFRTFKAWYNLDNKAAIKALINSYDNSQCCINAKTLQSHIASRLSVNPALRAKLAHLIEMWRK
jgi:hypothetical protein